MSRLVGTGFFGSGEAIGDVWSGVVPLCGKTKRKRLWLDHDG